MIIKQALKSGAEKLNKFKVKYPSLETEILLSFVLNKSREFLFTHYEKELTKNQVDKYYRLIAKRTKGEPIAYLVGQKEFYGFDFIVNKNVLIPRPETELIIDETLNLTIHNPKSTTIVDVGTGSGCIIITLAKLLNLNYKFIATDISKPALSVARQNAKLHGINKRIKFYQGDLLEPIIKQKYSNLIILANLPYLTPKQIKKSPTIKHEPKLALSAGKDGLKYYRKLFKKIIKLSFISATVLCEIDPSQVKAIRILIKKHFPMSLVKIKKDLSDHNRLVIISIRDL